MGLTIETKFCVQGWSLGVCVLRKVTRHHMLGVLCGTSICMASTVSFAEMLSILNYETKAEESLEALQIQGTDNRRREGIAIVELDPESAEYGRIIIDIPTSPEFVLHHIFYNRDATKAYVTALQTETLHVIDLTEFPYRLVPILTPGCKVQENIIFSDDNKTWYVSCMGSENVIVGDAVNDTPIKNISMPGTYPHGIALHEGIDRIVVASCVAPDFSGTGHTIEVIKASTGEYLGSIPVSDKKGAAPVEIVFVPGSDPPVAYVTNMMSNTLWAAVWDRVNETFTTTQLFNFKEVGAYMPLEIYFNKAVDRLYITSADPGMFHVFDISNGPLQPVLVKSLETAGGAHHVAITPDESRAYVQNSLLNLPGINDGSITVIDLVKLEVTGTIDTFKDKGLAPNSITMLPKWYNPAGHFNNGLP